MIFCLSLQEKLLSGKYTAKLWRNPLYKIGLLFSYYGYRSFARRFLDFLAKHLVYLYYFTFLRTIRQMLLSFFRYLCNRRINN